MEGTFKAAITIAKGTTNEEVQVCTDNGICVYVSEESDKGVLVDVMGVVTTSHAGGALSAAMIREASETLHSVACHNTSGFISAVMGLDKSEETVSIAGILKLLLNVLEADGMQAKLEHVATYLSGPSCNNACSAEVVVNADAVTTDMSNSVRKSLTDIVDKLTVPSTAGIDKLVLEITETVDTITGPVTTEIFKALSKCSGLMTELANLIVMQNALGLTCTAGHGTTTAPNLN